MNREKFLAYYELFPFERHPLWKAVLDLKMTKIQIVAAEQQHYLRTKAGRVLRMKAAQQAKLVDEKIWERLVATAMEECIDSPTDPSHLELIKRFLLEAGVTEDDLENVKATPGNAAAMALYKDISDRGSGCHLLGAGVVEHFYALLCPKVFEVYTNHYGFSEDAAMTYRLHGSIDQLHSNRAFEVLPELISLYGEGQLEESVRDAFTATSLHYDGMLQAAHSTISYWDGKS